MIFDFWHTKLILSFGFALEGGVRCMKCILDLYHESKDKLKSSMKMSKTVACVNNIRKKKESPVLTLFSKESTTALENEDGDRGKGA